MQFTEVMECDIIRKEKRGRYYFREVLVNKPNESDPRKYFGPAKEVMKKVAMEKILMCGSNGKA